MPATQPPAGSSPDPDDSVLPDAATVDGPNETDGGEPNASTVDWARLPEPVRARLAGLAAEAVADLPAAQVPPAVRPVARFARAKRAKLGATTLLAGLRDSVGFRAAVTEWGRAHRPELLAPSAVDAAVAAAAAVLLGHPEAEQKVSVVAERDEIDRLRAERDGALTTVQRLTAEVERLNGELDKARAAAEHAGTASAAEVDRLRGRLREQGTRLRAALDDTAAAVAGRDAELDAANDAHAAVRAERDRERDRADAATRRAERAAADADAARQAAREARQADEVRLALLVDTIAGAVTGLRRELAIGGEQRTAGPRPAELVRGASAASGTASRVEDPAALDRLLALASVHLVVDGYNVTKTGYPELTLAKQRERLIGQLAALAARTSAEVTVVFDGAGVVAVPTATPRGVRVLFSDPGVLADDVIRALVAAEPEGRPVVVVTSDRAVAESVRRRGAHPVASSVLLARVTR